jgi:peptide/nickel transport system substrate-binding protein
MSTYWDNYWRRRRVSRRSVIAGGSAAALGLATMAVAGCGGGDDDDDEGATGGGAQLTPVAPTPDAAEKPVPGGTLRFMGGPIGSLIDIHRTNTPWESSFLWHWCGNFLMRFQKMAPYLPEPDLAAAQPEITDGGTTLIFKLRPEAKWQNKPPVNGRQVTAEDVKASFERIKALGAKSPRSGNYAVVDSIEAIDATTVRFKLKAPKADLLNAMADQYDLVIPKEIAARGEDAITKLEDVVGSGPYEAAAFEAGQRIAVKKRPDGYWKPNTAWVDGAEVVNQTDNQALVNAIRANQTDSVSIPADLARQFENDANFYILRAPNPTRECLLINHTKERYKDLRVRQALWRAVDRKQVYDNVYAGAGIIGGAMTPAAAGWVLPDAELAKLPGFGKRADEIKEAKALLAAAGYPDGFEETIMTATAFSANLVTDVIVANLREVGIRLTIDNVGTDFATMLRRQIAGEYNLAGTLFLSGPYPDAQLLIYHHSDPAKGTRNYGKFADPEIDRLLDQQSAEFDYEKRKQMVFDLQRKLATAPGPVWIGSRIGFSVVNKRVRNVVATPFAAGYDDAEDVWIKA